MSILLKKLNSNKHEINVSMRYVSVRFDLIYVNQKFIQMILKCHHILTDIQ